MLLTVYRCTLTGFFGYTVLDGDREAFQFACHLMSSCPPVQIEGREFRLTSEFDRETTMVPGQTCREIRDHRGKTAGTLRYEDQGLYTLLSPEGDYLIEDRGGKFLVFSSRNRNVLTVKRLTGETSVPASVREIYPYYDVEPYYEMTADPGLSPRVMAMLAAFPLLRFDHDYPRERF